MDEKAFVSPYNKRSEGRSAEIFDTTLRDGEQTPGVSFTHSEKMHIAEKLDEAGVSVIEAGFPINSKPEEKAVKDIVGMGLSAKVCALARVKEEDIEAAAGCGVDIIHVFVSTSDLHLKYQLRKSRKDVLEMARKAVLSVKDRGMKCLFSPMDATRTEFGYLVDVCRAVRDAGADMINIPDTVGAISPPAMKGFIERIKSEIDIPIAVHCHNDFGLAVANSIAGVEGGADQVQVSVNGLGERAGNADLAQVAVSLEALYGVRTGIKTEKLSELSSAVERFSMINLPPNFPLLGKNAFAHESGIHAHAVIENNACFEPIPASMVGQKSRIVIGKHTGKHAVREILKNMGYKLSENQVMKVVEKVKTLAEKQKKIVEDDVIAIADDVAGELKDDEKIVSLKELSVFTGNMTTPTAMAKLSIRGKERIGTATGVGPVDALSKAIKSVVGPDIKLKEYNLKAITGGTDALADVVIKIEDRKRNVFQAEAVDEDVIMASALALIKGINKALSRGEKAWE